MVQVYATISERVEEEINNTQVTTLMGGFNVKIGPRRSGNHIEFHCLEERNESGEKFCTFAGENDLVAMNTFFELPPRKLYIWKSPKDEKDDTIMRNQIHHIMVNQRCRNRTKLPKHIQGRE